MLSRKWRTVGCSARFMMTSRLLYMQLLSQKTGRLAVGVSHANLPGNFVEQGNPLVPQQLHGLVLSLLPGRNRLLDQPLPLGRQPERLGTGIFFGHDLQPAVC